MSIGKTFENDFKLSLRSAGHWAERFRDNTYQSRMRGVASQSSPPDMVAVINGKPCLIELKAIRVRSELQGGSIPLSKLSENQHNHLRNFENQGYPFVAVMFYEGQRAVNRAAVMIPYWYWTQYESAKGRKSLKLSDLCLDVRPNYHFKWVGRASEVGPWKSKEKIIIP